MYFDSDRNNQLFQLKQIYLQVNEMLYSTKQITKTRQNFLPRRICWTLVCAKRKEIIEPKVKTVY